jgi:hypothetical protein
LPDEDPGIDIDPFYDFERDFPSGSVNKYGKDNFYGGGEEDDDDDEEYTEKKKRKTKTKNTGGKGVAAGGSAGKRGVTKPRVGKTAKGTPTPATDPGTLNADEASEYANSATVVTPDMSGVEGDAVQVKRKRGRPPGSGRGKKKKADPTFE